MIKTYDDLIDYCTRLRGALGTFDHDHRGIHFYAVDANIRNAIDHNVSSLMNLLKYAEIQLHNSKKE